MKNVLKCIGNKYDKTQDEKKCIESLQKQTIGITFNSQNSKLSTFSLQREEIFSGTQPKSAYGKSFSCQFSFPAARNPITKAKYVTFRFF